MNAIPQFVGAYWGTLYLRRVPHEFIVETLEAGSASPATALIGTPVPGRAGKSEVIPQNRNARSAHVLDGDTKVVDAGIPLRGGARHGVPVFSGNVLDGGYLQTKGLDELARAQQLHEVQHAIAEQQGTEEHDVRYSHLPGEAQVVLGHVSVFELHAQMHGDLPVVSASESSWKGSGRHVIVAALWNPCQEH